MAAALSLPEVEIAYSPRSAAKPGQFRQQLLSTEPAARVDLSTVNADTG